MQHIDSLKVNKISSLRYVRVVTCDMITLEAFAEVWDEKYPQGHLHNKRYRIAEQRDLGCYHETQSVPDR